MKATLAFNGLNVLWGEWVNKLDKFEGFRWRNRSSVVGLIYLLSRQLGILIDVAKQINRNLPLSLLPLNLCLFFWFFTCEKLGFTFVETRENQ